MKCMCCGAELTKPGQPVTGVDASRRYGRLIGMGWTNESLLAAREQLDYAAPGLWQYINDRANKEHK